MSHSMEPGNLLKRVFYWSSRTNSLSASLFRLYCSIFYAILSEARSEQFDLFTIKRVGVLACIIALFPALMVWNHIGFLLDDILFPDWRNNGASSSSSLPHNDEEVVFIVGNARSGTTWMHRLLSMERDVFTHMKTWEMLFAASISWRLLLYRLYDLDKAHLHGVLYTTLTQLEHVLVGHVRVHPIGLQLAEEDDWLMCHIGLSQLITFFLPCAVELYAPVIAFDESLPIVTKDCIFQYYADCIRRHQYAHRLRTLELLQDDRPNSTNSTYYRTPIYLSKSPPFTNRISDICDRFPRALVVCMVREPNQSVPSMVSYIAKVWSTFASPKFRYPDARGLFQMCIRNYLLPLQFMPLQEGALKSDDSATDMDLSSYQDDVHTDGKRGVRVIDLLNPGDVDFLIRSMKKSTGRLSSHICPPRACAVLKYWELHSEGCDLPRSVEIIIRNILTYFQSTSSEEAVKHQNIYLPSNGFIAALKRESGRKFVSDHNHSMGLVLGDSVSEEEFNQIFKRVVEIYQIS